MNSTLAGQNHRQHIFSPCRRYRYALWREWDTESDLVCMPDGGDRGFQYLMVVGLNPSTADETKDDPTLRRCMDFARRWGYGALCMTNLFAFRATQPRDMIKAADPVGPDNNMLLLKHAREAGMILAAWGKEGTFQARDRIVTAFLATYPIHCLGQNKDGTPWHPLYIPAVTKPIPFKMSAAGSVPDGNSVLTPPGNSKKILPTATESNPHNHR